jgi:alanine racemase
VGEEVLLLGESVSGEKVTAEDLAEWAGTNAYEIMTNFNDRIPRLFLNDSGG